MNSNLFLILGGLAAGILIYAAEYYFNRNSDEEPHRYGRSPRNDGDEDDDEDQTSGHTSKCNLKPVKRGSRRPGPDEVCPICQDRLIRREVQVDFVISLPNCGHWYHRRCALRLLDYHPSCPMCRAPIDGSKLNSDLNRASAEIESLNFSLDDSANYRSNDTSADSPSTSNSPRKDKRK